jgi:IclR family transcriptional regulator, acetate operon repressor
VEEYCVGDEPRYPIESVDNALRLLSMFASEETVRVKDAADMLGVSTGTAHRLLAMLAYRGYISQDAASKAYLPGPVLLSVGLRASSRLDLASQARPYLDDLNRRFDETIHLAVLRGTDVLFVDGVESGKALRVVKRSGGIFPAHCTSVGKALLAEMPRDRLLELFPEESIPQVTSRSIGRRTQLFVELDSTRTRGYAINLGELEDEIGSIAVAVRDPAGSAVAAIGIGAPLARLDDDRLREFAEEARTCADRLGSELLEPRARRRSALKASRPVSA